MLELLPIQLVYSINKAKFVTMNELKFVSAIFIIFLFFSLNDSPSNYEKCFLFDLKSSIRCQDTPFL